VDWIPTLNLPEFLRDGSPAQAVEIDEDEGGVKDVDVEMSDDDDSLSGRSNQKDENDESLEEKYCKLQGTFSNLQEKFRGLEDKCEMLHGKCDLLEDKCANLEEEMCKLRATLDDCDINEDFFVGDDHKTRYFTGFPTQEMLMIMFKDCEPYMSDSPLAALT